MKTDHQFLRLLSSYALLFLCTISLHGQQIEVPTPKNLKAELRQSEGGFEIHLQWDRKASDDTLTDAYYIFNNLPPGDELYLNGRIGKVSSNHYLFKVRYPYAADYHFAVRAVTKDPYDYKSELSDIVTVSVPSVRLPLVRIKEAVLEGEKLNVSWKYDQIKDLKAFNILINGHSMEVAPNKRKISLDAGSYSSSNLIIQMFAETMHNVKSEFSGKVYVSVK